MKELRSLLKEVENQGAQVSRAKNNHYKVVCSNGNVVFISSTPSDNRALENIKRDLRANGIAIIRKNRRN
jgi:hypothetical protein